MQGNTRNRVVSGLIWTYLERITAQLVSLVVTIILARLLTPTEYGIIAIVTIFTELSNVIVVNGFGTALVQKEQPSSKDYSTIFYSSMVITFALYVILFLFAPVIARFYSMPDLTPVLRVMGLATPIAGISSIQQSYISKKMEFKKFFFSTIIGTLISAIIGITLAYLGFGVWALVAQLLTNRIIDTTILSFTSGWKPTREFSKDSLIKLFSYSWKITLSSFLITLYDNIRGLVVGKKYSSDDLAYYNKGRLYPNLVAGNINTSISKVLFPALSNEQRNTSTVLNMTRRAIKESSYILTPLLFGLAACSKQFVVALLTEKWLPIVPYLQIMCIVYALQPMQTASIQAMKAVGKSDLYLKLEIKKKIINFAILLISLFAFNQVFIVAIGALLAEMSSTLINFPVNKKQFGYSYRLQFRDITPAFVLSSVMFVFVYLCGLIIINPFICLLIQIIVGAIFYIGVSRMLRFESYCYTISIIKTVVNKHRKGKENDSTC